MPPPLFQSYIHLVVGNQVVDCILLMVACFIRRDKTSASFPVGIPSIFQASTASFNFSIRPAEPSAPLPVKNFGTASCSA